MTNSQDHDKAGVERMLGAYYAALARDPVPERLLLPVRVLAQLGPESGESDRLVVFVPLQHGARAGEG